jgi:ribosomal-protein-alanine N-acetyltransferase
VSTSATSEAGPQLRTARLLLRPWRAQDLDALAALNADPAVMEHFVALPSRTQSAVMLERLQDGFREHGYGFWAVEMPGTEPLIGFIGLAPVPAQMPFAPGVEVGWRLAREHWGRGLAAEGAQAALDYGFGPLGLSEIVAYTAARNVRSRRLMERLGMRRDPREDFAHPEIARGHALAAHVLYRLPAPA